MLDVSSLPMAGGIGRPLEQVLSSLGAQLKALRTRSGWTLERLSKLTKLSEPYLSRLEAGGRQPSLAALLTLARVYNLSIRELLDSGEPSGSRSAVIRAGSSSSREANGLTYRAISGSGSLNGLEAMQIHIPAERHYEKLNHHDGEEWLYVLTGRVNVTLEDREHVLETGDAMHFDARTPHRLAAIGKRGADVLLVASISPRAALTPR